MRGDYRTSGQERKRDGTDWTVRLTGPGNHREYITITSAVADVLPDVLARTDAAEALDYVQAINEGGPSCGCGGDHWSCPGPEGDDDDG